MLMTSNKQIGELIIWESFAGQSGHYKLTCQCENISSAFTLLQSNNPLLIQNLGKFRRLAWVARDILGGIIIPLSPSGYGPGLLLFILQYYCLHLKFFVGGKSYGGGAAPCPTAGYGPADVQPTRALTIIFDVNMYTICLKFYYFFQ